MREGKKKGAGLCRMDELQEGEKHESTLCTGSKSVKRLEPKNTGDAGMRRVQYPLFLKQEGL